MYYQGKMHLKSYSGSANASPLSAQNQHKKFGLYSLLTLRTCQCTIGRRGFSTISFQCFSSSPESQAYAIQQIFSLQLGADLLQQKKFIDIFSSFPFFYLFLKGIVKNKTISITLVESIFVQIRVQKKGSSCNVYLFCYIPARPDQWGRSYRSCRSQPPPAPGTPSRHTTSIQHARTRLRNARGRAFVVRMLSHGPHSFHKINQKVFVII